ncbi:hypothetical protein [Lacticaseibacillus daqingensis]|uniref:hypothetical protein n=1 Tax=Lacticaseibacillus daqingensis TaxID=2486014 RepID=UPI000F7B83C6|nr:hypothetical protein [Lacticaseibacillus daqingensis]
MTHEALVRQLGALRQRLTQLEDVDYMTAYYKGYSASGDDLAAVQAEIETVTARIARLEARLAAIDWAD